MLQFQFVSPVHWISGCRGSKWDAIIEGEVDFTLMLPFIFDRFLHLLSL